MKQGPVAVGLFFCEQIVAEEGTRNVTPVNCFIRRTVQRFPSEPVPFIVFAVLTDGSGEVALETLVHRLDTLEEIYRVTKPYRFDNPLHEVRFILRVRGFSFPVSGHYQVTLLADNEVVAQRKLVIEQEEGSS
jgi:hypothetical protein